MIGPSGTRLEGGEVGVGLVDGLGVRLVVLADIGPFAPPRTTWLILLSEWTVYERRPASRRPDQPPSGSRHRPNATPRTGWGLFNPRVRTGCRARAAVDSRSGRVGPTRPRCPRRWSRRS